MQTATEQSECPAFLSKQIITYIGNKRSLLGHIGRAVDAVKSRLGKDRLRILDGFAGSGVVSRYFKRHASLLVSNDIEDFAVAAGRTYLRNASTVDMERLRRVIDKLNAAVNECDLLPGFIEELYAPRNEGNITAADRVFYTRNQRGAARQLSSAARNVNGR